MSRTYEDDEQAGATDNQSIEEIQKLLGKQVRVTLDYQDENGVAEGELLSFDDGGGFVLLDDMGFKHYCWPLLEVIELPRPTDPEASTGSESLDTTFDSEEYLLRVREAPLG